MSGHDQPRLVGDASRHGPATAAAPPAMRRSASAKLSGRHLERFAVVYVRQSSPQQVFDHKASRERQYALADHAVALGWPKDRVLVIDEDQGQSGRTADRRLGFQRLLAEVTMDHVGLVLGLELSRLSRSSKDWYHLLEVCAVFGTLLADQDGLYDPNDTNDRLILGLKGTMSEVELITMRNRLERGKLHKAERGELILNVPCGYVKLPTGEVAFDPDEQARSTVQMVFDKFDELGSFSRLYHYFRQNNLCMGTRAQRGPRRGELEWRPATRAMLGRMLHHPIYAGAYSYGRRRVDPKRTALGPGKVRMRTAAMSEWTAFHKDRLPAYINWERFLANQQRLEQNRFRPGTPGSPRAGEALLTGLMTCGACGRRMHAGYRTKAKPYYVCMRRKLEGSGCCGLGAAAVDDLVARQVLLALEPATLELSLKAIESVNRDRGRLQRHWQQRLERAGYEAQRAERQYNAVEPENRLVARGLERRWEEALRAERNVQEEYNRFLKDQPPRLDGDERARITATAADVTALWNDPGTTAADRKEVVRLIVDRVEVNVRPDSERTGVTVSWKGGLTTRHEIVRSVSRYESLSNYDRLIGRIIELRGEGLTIKEVAARLNSEGFRTPKSGKGYTSTSVRKLISRRGLAGGKPNA